MIKIPIHSATDLITNSSTVIFTYSGNSAKAMKEMIDEVFKTFGIDKTCDEVFDSVVLCNEDRYKDYAENRIYEKNQSIEGIEKLEDVDTLIEEVKAGLKSKPEWFEEAESEETHYE